MACEKTVSTNFTAGQPKVEHLYLIALWTLLIFLKNSLLLLFPALHLKPSLCSDSLSVVYTIKTWSLSGFTGILWHRLTGKFLKPILDPWFHQQSLGAILKTVKFHLFCLLYAVSKYLFDNLSAGWRIIYTMSTRSYQLRLKL